MNSPSDDPEPASWYPRVWILSAWEAWLVLETCYLVGIIQDFVRHPGG